MLLTGHIEDRHQRIRPAAEKLGAIGAPGDIAQRGRVALDHTQALPARNVPHAQRAVFAAAEQAVAVGGKGQTIHLAAVSMQRGPVLPLLAVP